MRPIWTRATTGIYGAPPDSPSTEGLPYYRTYDDGIAPPNRVPVIHSTWDLDENERRAIASGAKIELAIWGEPIHPVSLSVDTTATEIPDPRIPDVFHKGLEGEQS